MSRCARGFKRVDGDDHLVFKVHINKKVFGK